MKVALQIPFTEEPARAGDDVLGSAVQPDLPLSQFYFFNGLPAEEMF